MLLAVLQAGQTAAQDRPTAFVGADLIPISGPPIPGGVVIVSGGTIAAVGPAASTPIPPGAERIDPFGPSTGDTREIARSVAVLPIVL